MALYSGTIGGFLQSSPQALDRGQDAQGLTAAANWLKTHNRFLQGYTVSIIDIPTVRLPTFETSDPDERRPCHRPDLIVRADQYDPETHDEDFRFDRLLEGQDMANDDRWYSKGDKDLEARIFPWLYPYGVGHFRKDEPSHFKTAFKDAQYKLNWTVSHFRDDHYWATWMYMRAETLRIFQNTNRLMTGRKKRQMAGRLSTAELLKQSAYGTHAIINEDLTTTIPAQLRTGATYWIQAEQKINTIMGATCRPQLFLTTTFSEKWPEYVEILANTGNRDTIPSNRPWEAVVYYHSRWKAFKTYLLRNPKVSGFEKLEEMVERMEFQLRGAIHTHALLWTQKSIPQMIAEDFIRADVPDKDKEPELHALVMKHQIHTCRPDMCRKGLTSEARCKSGFPQPLSPVTEIVGDDQRYTYKRLKEEDRWVSPYNAQMLLIWNAHMNIQYTTGTYLAVYVSKYVTKAEPNGLYNLSTQNAIKEHLMARRMGSMEVMMLMLSYEMFRCSRAVKYLDTTLPEERSASVKPLWQLEKDLLEQEVGEDGEPDPFYKNPVEKYFARPSGTPYDQLTYFDYHSQYNLTKPTPGLRGGTMDGVGNIVKKRRQVRFLH